MKYQAVPIVRRPRYFLIFAIVSLALVLLQAWMLGVFDSCRFSLESILEKQIVFLNDRPNKADDLREKLILMMHSSSKSRKSSDSEVDEN